MNWFVFNCEEFTINLLRLFNINSNPRERMFIAGQEYVDLSYRVFRMTNPSPIATPVASVLIEVGINYSEITANRCTYLTRPLKILKRNPAGNIMIFQANIMKVGEKGLIESSSGLQGSRQSAPLRDFNAYSDTSFKQA